MRLDSVSVGTHSLQNSDINRQTAQTRPVVQDNQRVNAAKVSENSEGNKKKVETAVEKLNNFVEPLRTNLKFELHEDLNEYYVTVVNPNTNEVIKEIPSKKLLDMYAAMGEFMGFLIDKKI